jgi:peptide deformylase
MEFPIVIYGAPVLRKKSFDVDKKYDFSGLSTNMMQTLKNNKGVGLAAPQVGLTKNLFIIDTTPYGNELGEIIEKTYINPEILSYGEEEGYFQEGCLSIPGIFEDLKRPEKVRVRYRDLQFKWHEEILEGIASRIFQHEYDHLQGVLFIDKLNPIRKKMIKKKLNHIRKNTIKTG